MPPSWTSNKWPYERGPTAEQQAGLGPSSHQAAQQHAHDAAASRGAGPARSSAAEAAQRMQRSVQALLRSFRASSVWEVAVRRNGLTTSCLLLSGVLVADYIFFPGGPRQQRRQAAEAQRAAAAAAAAQPEA